MGLGGGGLSDEFVPALSGQSCQRPSLETHNSITITSLQSTLHELNHAEKKKKLSVISYFVKEIGVVRVSKDEC